MVPFQRPNSLFLLVIICFSTILAACSSGGGGKGGSQNGGDTTPDAFTIEARAGQGFDSWIESDPIPVSGIDAAAPVSISSGGEFRIDNGTFASTASTVRSGQTITVRVRSSVKAGQSVTATLNVGGVTAPFTVTTGPDTDPPEVAILFPPPASMTEGSTLFLRGTVKDVNGTLEEGAVIVNGVEAELDLNAAGDEGTWSVTVDLEEGENTLTVTAIDVAENENADESISSRRVASIAGESFPDNQNPFQGPLNATFGMFNGQQVAYVTDDTAAAIFAVSLNSGGRTLISDNTSQSEPAFVYPWAVAYGSEGVLYVSDNAVPAIFKVDLESGVRSVIATSEEGSLISEPRGIFLLEDDISSRIYVADKGNIVSLATDGGNQVLVSGPDQPDASNPINVAFGVVMSEQGDLIAIDSGNEKKMLRVDPDSGARSTLNSDIFSALNAIAAHPGERSVLVVDDVSGELSLINIGTGERVVLSSSLIPEGINVVSDPWGVATSPDHGYALVVDPVLKTVMAVDLVSGKRTVLSKSN